MTTLPTNPSLTAVVLGGDIWLNPLTRVKQSGERVEITELSNPGRLFLSIWLAGAGAALLHGAENHDVRILMGILALCGGLVLLGTVRQKVFDRSADSAFSRTWVCGIRFASADRLLHFGAVRIHSQYCITDGGAYWEFSVFVDGDTAGRILSKNYEAALGLARSLADFLSLQLSDVTTSESRSGLPPA